MDNLEKLNEASLPEKEDFRSHLKMEDITYADYAHVKRVCKDFQIKKFRRILRLVCQSDTLIATNVFENFKNICLAIYELDPAKFLSVPRLVWQAT